jgi:hypothetical protein
VPNTYYADSKALKMQSVSPLYNAQQGDLDVADARGGAWDPGFATTQRQILITIGMAKPPSMSRGRGT